nr:prolipoprotein diacylglyceryl transferase [Caldilineaceae bacterium]
PTFFYEATWNLLMFGLVSWILWRFSYRLRRGDGVLLYLIAYPLGRFWVEMFRPDAWRMGALATAQWIALGCILLSVALLIWRHRNWSWRDHPEETIFAPRPPEPTIPAEPLAAAS